MADSVTYSLSWKVNFPGKYENVTVFYAEGRDLKDGETVEGVRAEIVSNVEDFLVTKVNEIREDNAKG